MRLRFAIRDLLWLAVVVALAVGWWLDRSNVVSQCDEIAAEKDKWESRADSYEERLDYVKAIRSALEKRMLNLAKEQSNQEIEDTIKQLRKESAND